MRVVHLLQDVEVALAQVRLDLADLYSHRCHSEDALSVDVALIIWLAFFFFRLRRLITSWLEEVAREQVENEWS